MYNRHSELNPTLNTRLALLLTMLGMAVTLVIALSAWLVPASQALSAPVELGVGTALSSTAIPTVTLSTYYGGGAEDPSTTQALVDELEHGPHFQRRHRIWQIAVDGLL